MTRGLRSPPPTRVLATSQDSRDPEPCALESNARRVGQSIAAGGPAGLGRAPKRGGLPPSPTVTMHFVSLSMIRQGASLPGTQMAGVKQASAAYSSKQSSAWKDGNQ
jgi:hypothetical protein